MRRNTQRSSRPARRHGRMGTTTVLLWAVAGLVVFSFVLGWSVNASPERQAIAVEELRAVQPYKVASRVTGYVLFGVGAKATGFILGTYGLYYVLRLGLNWLDLRSRLVHALDGVFPLVRFDNGTLYDANRAVGENPLITVAALEVQRTAAIRADKLTVRLPSPKKQAEALTMAEPVLEADPLPTQVALASVATFPSLDHLVLGVGKNGLLAASLYELMHVLAVGASGFGKSAFLRMLIWQLARVTQPVEVVAIDVNGSEFNVIRDWERLLYPVARETDEAIAVLQAVSGEIARRKGLYEGFPTAYDLPSYNAQAQEPLSPLVVLTDEGTNLLNQDGIGDPLRDVTQTARQYGVYLLLAGQSAKHDVIDTQMRDNFSTRAVFHTSPSSRRAVLGESVEDVTVAGRAWMQMPGRMIEQVQVPFVSRDEVAAVLKRGRPRFGMPEVQEAVTVIERDTRLDDRLAALLADDPTLSDSRLAEVLFGYSNGRTVRQVQEALRRRRQTMTIEA